MSLFFSIVVPIYKVEKYLKECVESLLGQNFEDYEIILVDDGSPDQCPYICDELAQKNKRIKVLHKSNGGLSDARNAGTLLAKGKYITYVDSDDFWKGDDVLSGVKKIIDLNNNPDVVVSDIIKYYEHCNKYIRPSQICDIQYNGKEKIEILRYLYFFHADMKMSACQKFIRRELLTNISFEKGLLSEDIDWTLKIYSQMKTICVYPHPFYCYRQQREGSIVATASNRSFESLMFIIKKWSKLIPELSVQEAEKMIYFGYLAYQLTIIMSLFSKLDKSLRSQALEQIKSFKYLFYNALNFKTKRVQWLMNVLGIKLTCIILGFYLKIRVIKYRLLGGMSTRV